MDIFNSLQEYISANKDYKNWKQNRNLIQEKRLTYIKNNNISEDAQNYDIKQAKTILNAVDVMDEFSQTRAEDMEVITEQTKNLIEEVGLFSSMGIVALFTLLSKSFKNNLSKVMNGNKKAILPLIIPGIIISTPTVLSVIIGSVFGAGQEIKASRMGREEAIKTKLNNLNQFAVLTDEQEKQVQAISDTIKLPEKEAKKRNRANAGLGVIKSLKIMFSNNTSENTTNASEKDLNKIKLTDDEIIEAKKDKQLIQNIVEKIDVASQDYAENVELATSTVEVTALAGGFLVGGISHMITKLLPFTKKYSKTTSLVIGCAIPIMMTAYMTKIQKEASRVGRFKAKQDFLKNPEKIIYVDDDKLKDIKINNAKNQDKNLSFISFLKQIIKDNKEYKEYLKTENIELQKQIMARENIHITKEQAIRAKQLQQNIFKMFNKVDEKSQRLSERVEAIGEMCQNLASMICLYGGMGLSSILVAKSKQSNHLFTKIKDYAPLALSIITTILLNAYTTKHQKQASRVANMLAMNELDDYRNFANTNDAKNTAD